MKEQKYHKLQRKADDLQVQPSDRVWHRLEHRLDQDRGKISISAIRKWMSIAAGILLIMATIFLSTTRYVSSETLVLTDLEASPHASFTARHYIAELNAIYSQQGWDWSDGESAGKLKVNTNVSDALSSDRDSGRVND